MKELFTEIHSEINRTLLLRNTERLWRTELGQTFAEHHAAARLAEEFLRDAGCSGVERLRFPADGKTSFQDKTVPMAWRASMGRLEVVKSAVKFEDPVIADFHRHPFHLVKGSVSTPPDGVTARLITEEDLRNGISGKDALVLINPEHRPIWPKYRLLCDAGALGMVCDYLVGRYETPEAVQWVTAWTEGPSWHTLATDRPLIGYSVSPVTGDRLRQALRAGNVTLRAFSDGERYEGEIDAVTGIIPGREEREVWLLAHLYEPLANDNSSGVACAAEIARVLKKLVGEGSFPEPRFTLRLVFAMEMYGFAAFAEKHGGYLRDKVLCALNLDALPMMDSDTVAQVSLSATGSPSCADYLLEELVTSGLVKDPAMSTILTEGSYGDDLVLGDCTIGVPTFWMRPANSTKAHDKVKGMHLWHNSCQTMERVRPAVFHDLTALYATWAAEILGCGSATLSDRVERARQMSGQRLIEDGNRVIDLLNERGEEDPARENCPLEFLDFRFERERGRLEDFGRFDETPEIDQAIASLASTRDRLKERVSAHCGGQATPPKFQGREWRVAETMVIRRSKRGLPYDLTAAPREDRPLMNSVTYGPLGRALNYAEGKQNLAELLRRAQWETGKWFSPSEVKKALGGIQYLARYGYIDLECSSAVGREELVKAIRAAGIEKGDLLLVHSSLSSLGVVTGGANTVIDAFLEVLGEEGTLLMPVFTRSFYYYEGMTRRAADFRPYHPKHSPAWTGIITNVFRQRPGVIRSAHPTHSVAGLGPLAEACLTPHRESDPPTSANSPFGMLHQHGGKMAWLGARLATCTFFHYLEDQGKVPYLQPAICMVEDDDGTRRAVYVPDHVLGSRDFYRSFAEDSKIYRELLANGLEIRNAPVGFSELNVIGSEQMYELGMAALKKDPNILLKDPVPGN